jgi:hypothetical protein
MVIILGLVVNIIGRGGGSVAIRPFNEDKNFNLIMNKTNVELQSLWGTWPWTQIEFSFHLVVITCSYLTRSGCKEKGVWNRHFYLSIVAFMGTY